MEVFKNFCDTKIEYNRVRGLVYGIFLKLSVTLKSNIIELAVLFKTAHN